MRYIGTLLSMLVFVMLAVSRQLGWLLRSARLGGQCGNRQSDEIAWVGNGEFRDPLFGRRQGGKRVFDLFEKAHEASVLNG